MEEYVSLFDHFAPPHHTTYPDKKLGLKNENI